MIESECHPSVSVLVVCHNDGKWLPRCLESLRAQTIFDRMELIIADNASEDGSDQMARDLISGWPNSVFISTGGDHGFCVGVNQAAAVARGKYLHIINPDTWLEPDCLENLFRAVEAANAGAGGPFILNYEDDSPQSACPVGFDVFGDYVLPRKNVDWRNPFCAVGFFFIRRELFNHIGKLDEAHFMYGEEMDLSWRIWIAGERIIGVPEARIHHRGAVGVNPQGGATITENRTSVRKRYLANRNRLLTIAKNAQHILILMLLPCASLILLEAVVTLAITRNWSLTRSTSLAALADFWRLRKHVSKQRRRLKEIRRRSDFWLLRFFRVGFGRSGEVADILRRGFPKFNR
jgi:N-acetylglucosaminyl-diphospho-decaprenol L-rhamnosyltransferase